MGQTLANHAFVDLSLVGSDFDFSDSVQCHTDLSTCCSGAQGPHRGDWFFPDGTRLPFSGSGNIFEIRSSQSVYLQRINGATSPSGIYRCDIPTVAISTVDDISVRETIYLGAYASGGNIAKYKHRCFLSVFRDTNKHITRLLGIGTFMHHFEASSCLLHFLHPVDNMMWFGPLFKVFRFVSLNFHPLEASKFVC